MDILPFIVRVLVTRREETNLKSFYHEDNAVVFDSLVSLNTGLLPVCPWPDYKGQFVIL